MPGQEVFPPRYVDATSNADADLVELGGFLHGTWMLSPLSRLLI